MLITTVDITGLPCEIHRVRMRAHDGLCYDKRWGIDRGIRINADLKGRELVETIIHEVLHRAAPDMREEWVEGVAASATEVLFTPPFDELITEV